MTINSGIFLGGSTHAGEPTTGVFFGHEIDPVSGQAIMFLEVKGVSTMSQGTTGAYGLRSEAPVPSGWLTTAQTLKLTLSYGYAWVEDPSNKMVIKLTFGNLLSADIKDSIEAVSPRAGIWQKVGAAVGVLSAKVVQANTRKQVTTSIDGIVYDNDFSINYNPWSPGTGAQIGPLTPWSALAAPAANKLYASGGSLYIATDAGSGERYSALSNTTVDTSLYNATMGLIWMHGVPGYSIGFSGGDTWRVAIYADPVTGSTFGNYRRNG
jgi:hypothetical protein